MVIEPAVVAPVRQHCLACCDLYRHQNVGRHIITGFAIRQDEAERTSLIVRSGVGFARKAPRGRPGAFAQASLFLPAAEMWPQTAVLSITCCQSLVSPRSTSVCSTVSHTPSSASAGTGHRSCSTWPLRSCVSPPAAAGNCYKLVLTEIGEGMSVRVILPPLP